MNRLNEKFAQLKDKGRKALIPYITVGDPNLAVTLLTMKAMVDAGADVIELGIPFSDPVADGPVIQRACERALLHNASLNDAFEIVREFRKIDNETPIVFMGYLNPIEVMGYEIFSQRAADAGVDGILTVDMTPEESTEYHSILDKYGLKLIYLITPTTPEERIERIVSLAGGFVYYVSVKGVTGSSQLDVNQVSLKVNQIKSFTEIPVGVGFGIKDAQSAASIAAVSDAVIVGSAIVKKHADNTDTPEKIPAIVGEFIKELRQAIDKV